MSKQFEAIKCTIEIPDKENNAPKYFPTELDLNGFYGGKERGYSLQLGFYNQFGQYNFVQLDANAIKELKELLNTEY